MPPSPEENLEKVKILRWREIHEIVKTVGSACVLAAIVALVLTIRHEIPKIRTEVLPGVTAQLVSATKDEGKETRKLVDDLFKDLTSKTDDRAGRVQAALVEALNKTESDVNDRVRDVASLADRQLRKTNETLAGVQKSADKIANLAIPVAKTIEGVNKSLEKIDKGIVDPLTSCEDANPACFENRWRGISWDLESFLNTMSVSAPRVAASLEASAANSAAVLANVDGITGNIREFTENFVHPPKKPWYKRIGNFLMTLAKAAVFFLK